MLDEFLTRHLEDIEYEFMRLSDELLRAAEEETKLRDQITAIMEQQDVGLEIFSPRQTFDKQKLLVILVKRYKCVAFDGAITISFPPADTTFLDTIPSAKSGLSPMT